MSGAGRPKNYDKDKVLYAATNLFWEKGYESTSLEDLMRVMDLGKGSFYNSFGSKRDLFIECVRYYDSKAIDHIADLLANSERPIEEIKNIFRRCAESNKTAHFLGCFAGNIITELATIDPELTNLAKAHLKKLEALFLYHIKNAQRTGDIQISENPVFLARFLLNLWNGINITRRIYPNKKELINMIELHLTILK
ncbi:TetR/AcrR family transcriptional regulator [Flavihumibacter cheonanensis]|uniref:TetR/AcrR family transcriptional regulator n=1 Tax=Flavihumibacter cheonanensis TaxID=1442385 RepID=UPI001EF99E24|nr:TetR/AcrR family transcriptional regulator [Flavihumibacter cheonanensis]MCG7752785.1 TetR/AcrR family transcriptional regulator [Flavihumibacter cheonanensis]